MLSFLQNMDSTNIYSSALRSATTERAVTHGAQTADSRARRVAEI